VRSQGIIESQARRFHRRVARALQGSVADKEMEKRASRKSVKRASLRGEK